MHRTDGLWPTEFAVIKLTPDVEARIADLVKKACRASDAGRNRLTRLGDDARGEGAHFPCTDCDCQGADRARPTAH